MIHSLEQMFGARSQRLSIVFVDQHARFGFVPGHEVLEVFVVVDELLVAKVRVLDVVAAVLAVVLLGGAGETPGEAAGLGAVVGTVVVPGKSQAIRRLSAETEQEQRGDDTEQRDERGQ